MEFKKGDLVEVRDRSDDKWMPAQYLVYDEGSEFPFIVRKTNSIMAGAYKQCRSARPHLQVDHKVWVRDFEDRDWVAGHFSGWGNDGRIRIWCAGQTSHTTDKHTSGWGYYTLTDPKEEPCEK